MKDTRSLFKTAIGLGTFAILVILPTVFLGIYGAIKYPDASTSEFLGNTLVHDQPPILGALVLIGLVAAAISTADSQVFALGGETRSLLRGEDKKMMLIARIAIFVFAILALIFALMSSDELALLARASFAGTAILAPMIFSGIFYERASQLIALPWVTLGCILVLVGSQLGALPATFVGVRLDLLLLGILTVTALGLIQVDKGRVRSND